MKTRETERSYKTPYTVLWHIFGKKDERHEFAVSEFAAATWLLG